MDANQTASLPSGEPASGSVAPAPTTAPKKMTLREAVRAGVNSVPQFNGSKAPTPASDDLADFDPSSSDAPARAEPSAGPAIAEADAPGDGTTRPVEGLQDGSASKEPLTAPARWPEDRRKSFEALPEDAKRILLEREKEFNTGLTQNAQKNAESLKRFDAINGLFQDHHRQEMQAAGYDEVATVRELLGRHDAFNRDPVGYGVVTAKALGGGNPVPYVAALIKQAGITQEQLFGGQPQPQAQPQPGQAATPPQEEEWIDPAIVEIKQELATYKQFIADQKDREAREIARQQEEQKRSFFNAVSQFEAATNEDGSPKYPHVGAVVNEITRLVQNDPALYAKPLETLEAAYNQAIHIHPEIRQQLMEEEFSRRLAAREKEQAAQRALRASPARPSPGSAGGSVNQGKMSIKEAAKAAVARHVSR
jgi:hypothetical protein